MRGSSTAKKLRIYVNIYELRSTFLLSVTLKQMAKWRQSIKLSSTPRKKGLMHQNGSGWMSSLRCCG